MLRLEDVRIALGGFRLAADFAIGGGRRVAVMGPSGSGKSTLLGAIAGFVAPAAGRILWQGRDLAATAPGDRPVSIVFQEQNLFPHLTVAQNVGLGLDPSLRLDRPAWDKVGGALASVGLAGFEARRPGTLSGGEQSRVALARALIRARPILLLDEPFGALGPALKADMLDLVEMIAAETGATLLMVSHDPDDARRLCPETVLVAEGQAHPPTATHALLADPPPALAAYLGA